MSESPYNKTVHDDVWRRSHAAACARRCAAPNGSTKTRAGRRNLPAVRLRCFACAT